MSRERQLRRIDMSIKKIKLVSLSFVAASLAVLPGCGSGSSDSKVAIHYSQVGVCNGYASGSGVTSKRSNNAFLVFKIESLDSTKASGDFNFEPGRFFVDLEPNKETWGSSLGAGLYFVSTDRRFTDPLGVPNPEDSKVPAGKTTSVDRLVFIGVPTKDANGSAEASKISYHLSYDAVTKDTGRIPDPHIELVKTNDSQSTWPATDDCKDLHIS
jgi:hypothetical protein